MPKNKVKISKKELGINANELNTIFSQMFGLENADISIVLPKIQNIYDLVNKYNTCSKILHSLPYIKNDEKIYKQSAEWLELLSNFLNTYKDSMAIECINENEDKINKLFNEIKDNKIIHEIIKTTSNLISNKHYLQLLDVKYITRQTGSSFFPLTFLPDLELKYLKTVETDKAVNVILSILNKWLSFGEEIYDLITSPNIDIKQFSGLVVHSITKLRKQIPRCDKAFNIIEKSMELLENNFKGYYRNSIQADNPSIIIESFIIDVSNSQKADLTVTLQFKKIINHVRKQANNITDPKMKKIFGMLDDQFNKLNQMNVVQQDEEELIDSIGSDKEQMEEK